MNNFLISNSTIEEATKINSEDEYNGVEIWNVDMENLQVRRWRIPFPIVVIFILAVTAIVAIYYYFSE